MNLIQVTKNDFISYNFMSHHKTDLIYILQYKNLFTLVPEDIIHIHNSDLLMDIENNYYKHDIQTLLEKRYVGYSEFIAESLGI